MPSAASVKVEKPSSNISVNNMAQIATIQTENVDNNSPIRQALVIIEHKIRNLEKRKSKLESYRENEKSGKELTADQKVAVSKYDEVAMTLEFAREFSKQIVQIVNVAEKDLKKKQKKDETSRKQSETSKIREVLLIQDLLIQLRDDNVRNDFLNGNNGAFKLDEIQLALLDTYYLKCFPQRLLDGASVPFKSATQKAADHLSNTIDGKQKEFESSTSYAEIKTILKNIQKCAYFDKSNSIQLNNANLTEPTNENETKLTDENVYNTDLEAKENVTDLDENNVETEPGNLYDDNKEQFEYQEAPSAAAVPVPTFPSQAISNTENSSSPIQQLTSEVPSVSQQVGQTVPLTNTLPIQNQVPNNHQLHSTHVQPTTVHAVEQAYFKQHQYIQQIRPLAEVLSGGNFYFLQDSELDSPDMNSLAINGQQPQPQQQPQQQQIPSHTFANQTFPNVGYVNIKPQIDIQQNQTQQHSHIPGFATQNAPIPIPMVQPASIPVASPITVTNSSSAQVLVQQQQPSGQQAPSSQQQPQQQQQQEQQHNLQQQSITTFTETQQYMPNVLSRIPGKNVTNTTKTQSDQVVTEISEWKPEEISETQTSTVTTILNKNQHVKNKESNINSNTWRDSYTTNNNNTSTGSGSASSTTGKNVKESNEWNNEMANDNGQDESNNWPSNQRYQFRQNSNYGRNNNNRSNARNNGSNSSGITSYRGRNSSYQSNSGNINNANRNNENNGSNNTGNGNGGSNSNTFYRNNDAYYQNGGIRNDKNYRSRGDNNSSTYRSLQQRNLNQNNSERGHNSINNQSQRLTNPVNGGTASGTNPSRNLNGSNKHSSNFTGSRTGTINNNSARSQVDINA